MIARWQPARSSRSVRAGNDHRSDYTGPPNNNILELPRIRLRAEFKVLSGRSDPSPLRLW
jgi:hypothetical protein